MRFMIIVKATKESEAGVMPSEALIGEMATLIDGKAGEIEVRQLFELEDFGPSEAVDRFREMDSLKKRNRSS